MKTFILVILILFMFDICHAEVIGEYSYNICLDECCRKYKNKLGINPDYPRENIGFNWYGHRCKQHSECAECLDWCKNELQRNNPEEYKRLYDIDIAEHTPTSSNCFIKEVTNGGH